MGASKRPVSDLGPTFSIPVWSILELFDTKLVALQMTRMLLQQRRHYSRAVFPTPQRTRSTTLKSWAPSSNLRISVPLKCTFNIEDRVVQWGGQSSAFRGSCDFEHMQPCACACACTCTCACMCMHDVGRQRKNQRPTASAYRPSQNAWHTVPKQRGG